MSVAMISVLVILLLFGLFFIGLEIGFAMAIAGFIGFAFNNQRGRRFQPCSQGHFQCLFILWFHRNSDVCFDGTSRRQWRGRQKPL